MKSIKLIILFTLLVISAKADFSAYPVNKWMNGNCETTLYLITTGEAGPFTVDIEKDNLNIFHEEGLPSDVKKVSITDYGQFTVIFTDAFGCTSEVIVDALCDCDDLEYEVVPPSCHLDNGTIEIISPIGAMMTSEWTQWPTGSDAPLNNALVVGNLVPGIYVATFNISIPDPTSGDFISCEFEETFDLTDCNCEMELDDTSVIIEGTTSCDHSNGSILINKYDLRQSVTNYAGLFSDLQFKWTNDAGTELQDSQLPNNVSIDDLAEGFYHLTIIDVLGCEVTKTFEIQKELELEIEEDVIHPCDGLENGSIAVFALVTHNGVPVNQTMEYLWSPGESDESFLEGLDDGNYSLTITAENSGCTYERTYTLENKASTPIEDIILSELEPPNCEGNPSKADLFIIGGQEPFKINWSPNVSGNVLLKQYNFYESGSYTASVTDFCGNQKSKTFEVNVPASEYEEITNLEVDEVIDCEAYSGTTTLTFEGGKPPFKIYKKETFGEGWDLIESTVLEKRTYTVPYSGASNIYYIIDGCGNELEIFKDWPEKCNIDLKVETFGHPHPDANNGTIKISLHGNDCGLDGFCESISCPACEEVGYDFLYIPSGIFGITDDKMLVSCLPAGVYDFTISTPAGCDYEFSYELTSSEETTPFDCSLSGTTAGGHYEYNSCKGNLYTDQDGSGCGVSIILGANSGGGLIGGYLYHPNTAAAGGYQIVITHSDPSESYFAFIQLDPSGKTPFEIDIRYFPHGNYKIELLLNDEPCSHTNYVKLPVFVECARSYCYKNNLVPDCNCLIIYEYCTNDPDCNIIATHTEFSSTLGVPLYLIDPCTDCVDGVQQEDEPCNEFLVSNGQDDLYLITHNTLTDFNDTLPPHVIFGISSLESGAIFSNSITQNNLNNLIVQRMIHSHSSNTQNGNIPYQSFNIGEYDLGGLQTYVDITEAGVNDFTHVTFNNPFQDVPIILPTLTYEHGDQEVHIKIKDVSRYGFKIKLRDVDNVLNGDKREVSFIAIEEGETSIGGRKVVVGKTLNDINHNWTNISFPNHSGQSFPENHTPYFFAFPQTSHGASSPFVMYQNLSQNGVEISLVSANEYITQGSFSNQEVGYLILGVDMDCICDHPVTDIDYEMVSPNCGMNNAQLEFKPIGGTPPYDFKVNGSIYLANTTGSVELENLIEGTYQVEILDSKGCLYEEEIILAADELNLDDYLAENVECQGGEFNVTLNPIGGVHPFTYSWNNSNTTEELKSVGSGQYYVTVVDAEGCIGTRHFNLRNMYLSISKEDASCDQDNGSLTAHPIGVAPFEYLWSNGATSSKIDDLAPGTYYVTVTDAAGCTKSANKAILPDGQSHLEYEHPFCGTDNGYAELLVDGIAPINYLWNTGQTTNKINNLGPGIYSVTATDATGCISVKSITLNNTNSISLSQSGGNEGFNDGKFIPAGVTVNWSFNPASVTDQLIISSDEYGVIVNTGGVTRRQEACCSNINCCSDFFLGDFSNSPIDLIVGSGFVLEGVTSSSGCVYSGYLTGSFTTQVDGYITVEVIGSNCGGSTFWSAALSCSENTNNILAKMDMENSANVEQELILSSEEENANSISIFPNPANSTLYIDTYDQLKGFELKILDVNGKIVIKSIIESTRETIDVSDISNGIYFIIIESSSSLISERVVINR